jgi:hypothetical protein
MHVIPHGATKKLLPLLENVTPRAKGGVMEMRPPGSDVMISEYGNFAMLNSEYGTGYADNSSQPDSLPGLPSGISDEKGMVQTRDLPGATSTPYQPDPVKGPWASLNGAMPGIDRTALRRGIQEEQNDTIRSGVKMVPGSDRELVQDQRNNGEWVPLSVMKERVADRAIDANNTLFDIRDRAERDRVQADLAARASRPALGTSTSPPPTLPGMTGYSPSTRQAIDRNMERFLRTPQGALYATEQAQQQQAAAASAQAAGQWQMMTDPSSGKPFAMVNGRGQTVSLPKMEDDERVVHFDRKEKNEFGMDVIVSTPYIVNVRDGTARPFDIAGEQPSANSGNPTSAAAPPGTAGGPRSQGRFAAALGAAPVTPAAETRAAGASVGAAPPAASAPVVEPPWRPKAVMQQEAMKTAQQSQLNEAWTQAKDALSKQLGVDEQTLRRAAATGGNVPTGRTVPIGMPGAAGAGVRQMQEEISVARALLQDSGMNPNETVTIGGRSYTLEDVMEARLSELRPAK